MLRLLLLLLLATCAAGKDYWSVKNLTISPEEYALLHGLRHVRRVLDYDIFRSEQRPASQAFLQTPGLEREVKRVQHKRYYSAIADPLYPQQFHLHQLGMGEVEASITGAGVTLAIVDDGLQTAHPDLAPNVDLALSYDFNHNRPNVNPYHTDAHGTAAAGVAGAVANNVCGRGVATQARLVGIRLIAEGTYDYQEAEGLQHRADAIRIYSCSWGPEDSGDHLAGPGRIAREVLDRSQAIYIWAAGNGRQNSDNCNYDGYANHPHVMAIGAVDHNGQRAYYSEGGACLFAVTPSSGAGLGVVTTDLMDAAGYSNGHCTNRFGGTSSSAPLAAGIVALMLQLRPELTRRDVMHIVAAASSGQGRHDHDIGFGLMRIPPLLAATRVHKLVGPQQRVESGIISSRQPIRDNGDWTIVHIDMGPGIAHMEHIVVTVEMDHACRGQVLVEFGDSKLAEHRGDCNRGTSTWSYSTVHEWGKPSQGRWVFRIRDDTRDSQTGNLHWVSVIMYGTA